LKLFPLSSELVSANLPMMESVAEEHTDSPAEGAMEVTAHHRRGVLCISFQGNRRHGEVVIGGLEEGEWIQG
jgi:hypothetical protein